MEGTRAVVAALAMACLGLAPALAGAEELAENDDAAGCFERRQYDACFREGKRQYGADDYDAAYRAYLEGWRLQRNYEVAGNLGNVELKLGKHGAAYTHLKYSLERLPPSQKTSEIVERLGEKIREALAHVGARKLEIEPPDATITIDGETVETDPELWLALQPGEHVLRVESEGYAAVERRLDVRAGEEKVVEITLVPSTPPATSTPAPDEGSTMSTTRLGVGLAGVGLGVAGGIASVVLGVMSVSKGDDAEALQASITADPSAPRTNPCGPGSVAVAGCAELTETVDDRDAMRNAAIGVGAASAAILVGSILVLVVPVDDDVEVGVAGSSLRLKGRF